MNRLLILIIFFILSQEDRRCRIIAKITEESGQGDIYSDRCVYIDTNEYNNFEAIIIETCVKYDQITKDFLYYGETPDEPIKNSYVTLTNTQTKFKGRVDNIGSSDFIEYYYFKMPKTTERYLLVTCPDTFFHTRCEISYSIEMSSLAISLIVIGSIIFVVAIVTIIIICLVKRKKKRSLIFLSNNDHSSLGNDFSSSTDDYSSPDKEYSKPINDNSSSINDNLPQVDDLPPPPSTDYPSNKYTPNSSIYK